MNLSAANSEPYYQFHRRNEELNRTMRITVAGLAFVRQQKRTSEGPTKLPTDGEPFGNNLWNNPGGSVLPAKKFVAQMGVAHIVTLLEDFCVGIKAEHDRFAAFSGKAIPPSTTAEDIVNGLSPKALYAQLQFRKDVMDSVEPLYDYFVKVRNCVVHRSGRVSKELNAYATNAKLLACVTEWKGPRGKKLPPLPPVAFDDELALLPRHAILASEVCRKIAMDANDQLVRFLGEQGMIFMAAYHSLLSEKPILTAARNTAQAVLNYIATDRYRIGIATRDEAVQVLSKIGRWKPYLRKFERLKQAGRFS